MTRCKTGKRLLHEWANKVKAASMDTWQSIFFGQRKYDTHLRKCKTCQAVERKRYERQ